MLFAHSMSDPRGHRQEELETPHLLSASFGHMCPYKNFKAYTGAKTAGVVSRPSPFHSDRSCSCAANNTPRDSGLLVPNPASSR